MIKRALAPLALLAPFVASCGPHLYALPASHSCPPKTHDDTLRAASIDVDNTPPIGLSLFGHGLEGRIAAGLLTHLRCRGSLFRKDPNALAWVSCDLQSISLALSRRIAELVRDKTGLGTDRIIISATHTHAGPAHFTEGRAYITAIGGSREPSYDQLVVDFIARQVADGILAADAPGQLKPVEIRSALPGERFCVDGVNRNRAMPAFLRNAEKQPPNPCFDPKRPLDPTHESVNRELTVIRVDKVGGGSLGLMAVFAVHTTAIGNINERYHGDLFAFASRYCEDTLELRGTPGICALANGAEGDVSPDWAYQGELESRRLGERLGAYLVRAFERLGPQPPDPPALASRYKELILPYASVKGEPWITPRGARCENLSPYAEIGTPVGGGAPDGPTRLRIFEQLNQGIFLPERADPCNWPRAAVLGVVPESLESSLDGFYFPVQVPIEWFRIGRQAFVAIPGEATTRTGDQLEAAARCALPSEEVKGVTQTRVVGLTNSYLSYIATQQEYGVQFYEGAETLYGPLSARFFADEVSKLVCEATVVADPFWDRCPAAPAPKAAESEEPLHKAGTTDGPNPNLPPPRQAPIQPVAGSIGTIFMSPDPVRRRWPTELDPRRACFTKGSLGPAAPIDPAKLDAPPEAVCGPFWTCQSRSFAMEVSWQDTPGLALCGTSTATLLASPRKDSSYFIAHAALTPPEKLLAMESWTFGGPEAPRAGANEALEKACRGQFSSLNNEAGPVIDDEHGFVQLWFDAETDRWHARFRAPEYRDWAGKARYFRFAIRDAAGKVRMTPALHMDWDPANPPPCHVPTAAEIKCDTRCAP